MSFVVGDLSFKWGHGLDDLVQGGFEVIYSQPHLEIGDGPADVRPDHTYEPLCCRRRPSQPQLAVDHDDRQSHSAEQTAQIFVGVGQFLVPAAELFVDGPQLLVGGLQLFFGRLELLIGAL